MTAVSYIAANSNVGYQALDEGFLSQFNNYYRRPEAASVVYRLYNGICQSCGQRISSIADMDIGHIVPQSRSSFFRSMFSGIDVDNLVNLQAQHASCNRAQGNGFITSQLMVLNVLGKNERKLRQRIVALSKSSRIDYNEIRKLALFYPIQLPEPREMIGGLWSVPATPIIRQISQLLRDIGWPKEIDMIDGGDVGLLLHMLDYGMRVRVGYFMPDDGLVRRMFSDLKAFAQLDDGTDLLPQLFPNGLGEPIFAFKGDVPDKPRVILTGSSGFSLGQAVQAIDWIDTAMEKSIGPDNDGYLSLTPDDDKHIRWLRDLVEIDDCSPALLPEHIMEDLKDFKTGSGWLTEHVISRYSNWKNYGALKRLVSRFGTVCIFREDVLLNIRAKLDRYFQQDFRNAFLETETFRENLASARPDQLDLFHERATA